VQEHCPQRFGGALVWTLTSGRIVTAFGTKKAAGGWFMLVMFDFALLVPCCSSAAMHRLILISQRIG